MSLSGLSNFLKEFWSTDVSYDPFPSTDETEQCTLKEFLIKFSVLNRQRPLTLNFTPFVHPLALIIIMVLGGNYSSTKQVNSIQQLLAYSLITGTEVDIGEINYNESRKATHPKDSGGNKQPLDRDITSTTPDEVLAAGEDMDEDPQNHTDMLVKASMLLWTKSATDKLVEASMSSLDKSSNTITQPITTITTHPESSQAAPRSDKGKGIATESDKDPSKKLVSASTIVYPDPDEEVKVPYMINGKMYYLTDTEMQAYMEKEEKLRKATEEARLLTISKPEVIKVVQEEAKKIRLDLKKIASAKAGEKFKKAQDAEHEVLKRQHTEKVEKSLELRKHKFENYIWTISSRLKPETIIDIKIHAKTKPDVITVFRGTDGRNFDVHKPFTFGEFGISKLDELREIIPKKKNAVVQDLMNSLSRRKHMELEPKIKIPGLECNRSLPENVLFVNNMVIEEPECGIFFTDEFGDQAFQRWSDIDKVGMEALVSYLVAASMVKSPKNARFGMKLKKLIVEHHDQEKLKSKKVKLETLGYEMN
ncbi:hypothetical protein Tco_1508461 [Tanacetum coccineum]